MDKAEPSVRSPVRNLLLDGWPVEHRPDAGNRPVFELIRNGLRKRDGLAVDLQSEEISDRVQANSKRSTMKGGSQTIKVGWKRKSGISLKSRINICRKPVNLQVVHWHVCRPSCNSHQRADFCRRALMRILVRSADDCWVAVSLRHPR